MKKNIAKIFALAAAFTLVVSGCGNQSGGTADPSSSTPPVSASAYPVTIQTKGSDFVEVEQTFEQAPTKIVTANASSIDMLYRLGLADKIVGTIAIDNEPSAEWADLYSTLPVLGDKMTISKEVIAAAEPDIIIGRSATFAEGTFGSIAELNDLGINVYAQKASDMSTDTTMQSIIEDVLTLGKIFDVQATAEEYAATLSERLQTVTNTVEAAAGTETQKVLVMATYQDGTFVVFGANAKLQSSILETLNCVNVMEKGGSALTLENLISANPDVIIYITSQRNAEIDLTAKESLLNESILASVPAIANEKIIEIPYDAFMDYGVRNFDTLEVLADFLY